MYAWMHVWRYVVNHSLTWETLDVQRSKLDSGVGRLNFFVQSMGTALGPKTLFFSPKLRLKLSGFKLVLLEWSDSRYDGRFGFSMLRNPPCANFWSNRGNQWLLTAYCNFCLMTLQFKLHRTLYKNFEFYFHSLSHYFEKVSVQYHLSHT